MAPQNEAMSTWDTLVHVSLSCEQFHQRLLHLNHSHRPEVRTLCSISQEKALHIYVTECCFVILLIILRHQIFALWYIKYSGKSHNVTSF